MRSPARAADVACRHREPVARGRDERDTFGVGADEAGEQARSRSTSVNQSSAPIVHGRLRRSRPASPAARTECSNGDSVAVLK